MKKKIMVVLMFMLCMFIGVKNVNANTNFMETINPSCKVSDDSTKYICEFKIRALKDFYKEDLTLGFTNLKSIYFNDGNVVTPGSSYQTLSIDYDKDQIALKKINGSYVAGTEYTIATVIFDYDRNGEKCNVSYYVNAEIVSCGVDSQGNYYDINGKKVTKAEMIKSCFKVPNCKSITISNNGQQETVFVGINGDIVSEEEYNNQCGPKTICKIKDGKYYDKDGNETTKEEYVKQCEMPCSKLEDGTYVGTNGTIVSEEDYNKECTKKTCEIAYGNYYDKNGNITTKEEYIKQCKQTCSVTQDGEYIGKDGNLVSKSEYDKQCNNVEVPKCKEENGTYYDKDGNVTTKENYELTCKVLKCEVINDNYFNDKGNKVTKEEYDKVCTNPGTGINLPYFYIAGGIIAAGLIFIYSKKHKKINRI